MEVSVTDQVKTLHIDASRNILKRDEVSTGRRV